MFTGRQPEVEGRPTHGGRRLPQSISVVQKKGVRRESQEIILKLTERMKIKRGDDEEREWRGSQGERGSCMNGWTDPQRWEGVHM